MTAEAHETAYYLRPTRPMLALVAAGVPFPPGNWIRVASAAVTPALVEELVRDLFPALRNERLPFCALLTEFDVAEFERFGSAPIAQ